MLLTTLLVGATLIWLYFAVRSGQEYFDNQKESHRDPSSHYYDCWSGARFVREVNPKIAAYNKLHGKDKDNIPPFIVPGSVTTHDTVTGRWTKVRKNGN